MPSRILFRHRYGVTFAALLLAVIAVAVPVGLRANSISDSDASIQPTGIFSTVEVTWNSPPSQTSSRFLAYEIMFSEPVRGIAASDFVSDGATCAFTIPTPSREYSTRYSVLMTCPPSTYGTVFPLFVAESVSTQLLDATPFDGQTSGRSVEIIPGTVITVALSGSGSGSVTSDLSGINCGLLCTGAFPPNTRLTLTAQPDPGNMFVGWTGACSGTRNCSVTLSSSRNVTAVFEPAGTIIVTKVGSGGGVVSAASSLNCGTSCRSSHLIGQTVTVSASPNRTSRFIGWAGACSGTGTCSVKIARAEDIFIYAIFEPR